jgi:sugar lactone lactonase YvrE
MTIPMAGSFLNAITFDANRNIYVSDSRNGIIWTATGCMTAACPLPTMGSVVAKQWAANSLLMPPTDADIFPSVGANGIAFSNSNVFSNGRLLVANTGRRNIIAIPSPIIGGPAGTPFVLATGINGPDGIAVQTTGTGINRVWVAANQSDEIVIIDGTDPTTTPGRVIHKMGDFNGITHGEPVGLLFPASVAFSSDGATLYVTNFAFTQSPDCPVPPPAPPLPCTPPPSIDSAWTQKVTAFTVVKFERITEFTPITFP